MNVRNVYLKTIDVGVLEEAVLWPLTFMKCVGGILLLILIAFCVFIEI
jgi:hypothetical protein